MIVCNSQENCMHGLLLQTDRIMSEQPWKEIARLFTKTIYVKNIR